MKENVQDVTSVPESNSELVTVCALESRLKVQMTVSPVLMVVTLSFAEKPHATFTVFGPVPVVVDVDVVVVVVVVVDVVVVVVGGRQTPFRQLPLFGQGVPSGKALAKKQVSLKHTPGTWHASLIQ